MATKESSMGSTEIKFKLGNVFSGLNMDVASVSNVNSVINTRQPALVHCTLNSPHHAHMACLSLPYAASKTQAEELHEKLSVEVLGNTCI